MLFIPMESHVHMSVTVFSQIFTVVLSYSAVVLYIKDYRGLGFSARIPPKD